MMNSCMAKLLEVGTEGLPIGGGAMDALLAFVFESMPIPTLAFASAVAGQSLERNVPIAGIAQRLLKERDPVRFFLEPLECIAHAA